MFMGMYLTEISLAPIYSFRPLGSSSEQITAPLRSYGFRRRGVGLTNHSLIYLINDVDLATVSCPTHRVSETLFGSSLDVEGTFRGRFEGGRGAGGG